MPCLSIVLLSPPVPDGVVWSWCLKVSHEWGQVKGFPFFTDMRSGCSVVCFGIHLLLPTLPDVCDRERDFYVWMFFFFFECVGAPKHQLWRASKELAIAHGSGGTTCFVQSSFARCDFVFLFLFQRSETKRNIIGGVACYPFPVRGPQNRTTGTKITISDSCGGRAFQLRYQITLHFQTICWNCFWKHLAMPPTQQPSRSRCRDIHTHTIN